MASTDHVLRQGSSSMEGCTPEQTAFLAWFNSHGGVLDARCRLAEYEGLGAGMLAVDDIAEDEIVFSIPRHMPLNLNTSQLSAMCTQYDEEREEARIQAGGHPDDLTRPRQFKDVNTGWSGIILTMLWERYRRTSEGRTAWEAQEAKSKDQAWYRLGKGQEAKIEYEDAMDTSASSVRAKNQAIFTARDTMQWGEYFGIMPTEFDTPMFWSAQELNELRGTSILEKLGREEAETAYNDHVLPYICAHLDIFLGDTSSLTQAAADGDSLKDSLIEEHYSLSRFHIMGSLLLSRAFHLAKPEKADGADTDEVEGYQSDSDNDEDSDGDGDEEEEGDEQPADVSMVPMADMLNARFGCDNARLFHKPHALEMRATRNIKAGEQVWNTYGEPPSSDLLRRYGYVDLGNPADVVELSAQDLLEARLSMEGSNQAQASELRQQCSERLQWACSLGVDDVSPLTYAFAPTDTPPYRPQSADVSTRELREAALDLPEDMLVLARVLCLNDAAFAQARSKDKLPNPRIDAVEGEDEAGPKSAPRSVTALLSAAIDHRRQAYATSVEQDEELLYGTAARDEASPRLSRNVRNAIVVRLSEKRILLDTQRILAAVQEAVALKKRKADRHVAPSNGKKEHTSGKKARK